MSFGWPYELTLWAWIELLIFVIAIQHIFWLNDNFSAGGFYWKLPLGHSRPSIIIFSTNRHFQKYQNYTENFSWRNCKFCCNSYHNCKNIHEKTLLRFIMENSCCDFSYISVFWECNIWPLQKFFSLPLWRNTVIYLSCSSVW